ncbi:MAG: hypothetical protein RLZZ303_2606 [Candidatus Hydrogenedentota bacterium]
MRSLCIAATVAFACLSAGTAIADINLEAGDTLRWYKGNTHTHTLWSDGEAAPEYAAKWYKDRGYHFLCLSDHNILSSADAEKWMVVGGKSRLMPEQVELLKQEFGADAVELRDVGGVSEMRLKTLPEVKTHFEEPEKFLLIQAEEITCMTPKVHVNGINVRDKITPLNSSAAEKSMQHAFEEIAAQEAKYGVPMFGHLNHPNWSDGVPVQTIVPTLEVTSFEVFNGHPGVRNWGNESRGMVNTDRIWDIILAMRIAKNPAAQFLGFATDDTHDYFQEGPEFCNGARGWVMVLADKLDADTITAAMKGGRFYSTSGVTLNSVKTDVEGYRVEIAAEEGVTYKTQFIGTHQGFDDRVTPVIDADGNPNPNMNHLHSDSIGVVLQETEGSEADYRFTGDELYVRAKIISSKPKENPFAIGDVETAWTQPYVLKR